jgi:ABC-type transporter Mla subunit MlaD
MTEPAAKKAPHPAITAVADAEWRLRQIRTRLGLLSERIIQMSATGNEATIQNDTAAIGSDLTTITTDLTGISNDIGSLVASLQPGNTVTDADAAALTAVKAQADALVTAANAALSNAGTIGSPGTIANPGT